MSTPDQTRADDHDRPEGGVRGAINDLLGRGDRTDDDRRVEERHLTQERSDAGQDAGTLTPAARPADDAYGTPGTPGRPADATVGAAAPQGSVDDRTGTAVAGGARHVDVGPDGPGYDAPTQATTRATTQHNGTGAPAQRDDTAPASSSTTAVADTAKGEDAQGRERLVSTERAASYGSRWDAVKGEFVDEPRKAVADADALVGELLDELQTLFSDQRRGIEHGLDADETSTEDMRLALRRYRSFFDRLLSI